MHDPLLPHTVAEIRVYSALMQKFFAQALEARMAADGAAISPLEHGLLSMLEHETLTISEMGARLGMDPSTMVRAVDALECQGLACRGVDPNDRRRNPVTITEAGLALMRRVPPLATEDPIYQAVASLGPKAGDLTYLLRQVVSQFPEGKMVAEMMSPPQTRP